MKIKNFGKANVNDIRSFETRNVINLPSDYIKFLLINNGGVVENTEDNSFYIKTLKEKVNMDVFFGIKTEDYELDLQSWLNDYKSDMPNGMIIIGDTYQHGFIVLLCSGEDAGVYYWDHAYEFPCSNDESNTYFVADTFTDFINQIK